MVKNPPANAGDARDLGWEDPLEEGMATHSSILAWRISWTEEPGGLWSTGLQRVSHINSCNNFEVYPLTVAEDSSLLFDEFGISWRDQ